MLVSCLLPTYNRYPDHGYLLEEAVQSFIAQDYQHKELIILNDTPGQSIVIQHPKIKCVNVGERFDRLGNKIHHMLHNLAQGDYICRWDDDDVSLPWRLSYSVGKLVEGAKNNPTHCHSFRVPSGIVSYASEWRPECHWFYHGEIKQVTYNPGNTHIMAIWHRDILGFQPPPAGIDPLRDTTIAVPITYPGEPCPSGLEDQTFTAALRKRGYPFIGDRIPLQDIFYLYRWGVQPNHLSGKGGMEVMQKTYEQIGQQLVMKQTYTIRPKWQRDYCSLAAAAARQFANTQAAT